MRVPNKMQNTRRSTDHSSPSPIEHSNIPQNVLAVVRELVAELHPRREARIEVRLDSDIDRDLGIDSLGRAELLHRLDRAFRVRLPERLIGEARTPQDLVDGVLKAKHGRLGPPGKPSRSPLRLHEAAEPLEARTLIEVLTRHVEAHPDRPHIRLWVSDDEEEIVTYRQLDERARAAAAGLLESGVKEGERVAIMLPTGRDFFVAFFAVIMIGAMPVPVYPPMRRAQIEDHLRRQAGILRNAQASHLITDPEIRPLVNLLKALVEDLRTASTVDELRRERPLEKPVPASTDTTALIQYTSGSTGDPKGVVLSHANLLDNIRAMGQAMEASSRDVFVSWLPLYHDMGLIGAWLGSLYYGAPVVIMSPLTFLANPARWLWAIDRHGATLSAAPNFAFELCLKYVRDEDIEGLYLSTLRMVVNGAEPVSPKTIRRFTERFQACGFRASAMAPVYGLAEASVGLAFPPVGREPVIERIERIALARDGIAIDADPDDPTALEFVACGRPLPGHQIRIVDEIGSELPDRRQGRLEFKGPSTTKGYFRNEEKTRALFSDGWLDSGDIAYVSAGDIFLTGRVKDMIIRAGRNIYPHELEEAVGEIEGMRKGCVAVFASRDDQAGTERLIVMAETRLMDAESHGRLREQIAAVSVDLIETPPDDIVLVPPRTVPKTSSGKIRRSAARALFETGSREAEKRALWLQLLRLYSSAFVHRARRSVRRVVEQVYAGWWWLVLVALAAPTWLLVIALPRPTCRHALVRAMSRLFLRLTGISLRVEGSQLLPHTGYMIVTNHSSYIDGVVLIAALDAPLNFVAKSELQHQLLAGPFLRRLGTIFVRRTDPKGGIQDTAAMLGASRRGATIVTMPEGTISRMTGLLPFHLGAFLVAAQAGVTVVPVTLKGTRMILRSEQWLPRRGSIIVHIGEHLRADDTDFAAAVRLRDRCRAAILSESGEPDLAHERIEVFTGN